MISQKFQLSSLADSAKQFAGIFERIHIQLVEGGGKQQRIEEQHVPIKLLLCSPNHSSRAMSASLRAAMVSCE